MKARRVETGALQPFPEAPVGVRITGQIEGLFYVVQVPPRARLLLLANGHVCFADPSGPGGTKSQQFAELVTDSLYSLEFGRFWERADYLGLESFLI